MTLAYKHKLKTMRKAFKIFGFNLKVPDTDLTLYDFTQFKVINEFRNHEMDKNNIDKILISD